MHPKLISFTLILCVANLHGFLMNLFLYFYRMVSINLALLVLLPFFVVIKNSVLMFMTTPVYLRSVLSVLMTQQCPW